MKARHQAEETIHQLASDPEHQRKCCGAEQQAVDEDGAQIIRVQGQRRDDDEAGHHGQILKEQHGHGATPRARVQFKSFRQ